MVTKGYRKGVYVRVTSGTTQGVLLVFEAGQREKAYQTTVNPLNYRVKRRHSPQRRPMKIDR